MLILDKYILRELAGPFIFGVAAFSSIFIGTDTLFRLARFITEQHAAIPTVIKLFFYSLPRIVVLTFPMSMLLASLMAFARLSSSSEIVAMKSGGLSFYRLALPVVITAFFVSIFAIVFMETVVPRANAAYANTVRVEIQKNTLPKSQDHVLIRDVQNGTLQRLIYARKFEPGAKIMYGVDVQEFDNGRLARIENAEQAVWDGDRWIMSNGIIYDLSSEGRLDRTMRFDKQVMASDKSPQEVSNEQKSPSEMTIKELKQQIAALSREYAPTGILEVELYQRLAVPMASLVFALIGTPLGLQPHRSGSSVGLGLSIIIIFIYYSIMTVSTALGQSATIPPWLGACFPDIAGIFFGAWLVYRASR